MKNQGILLNPGDRIYIVYRSAIWYDDEYYNISNQEVEEDYEHQQLIKISSHIDKAEAESIAELLHQQIMQEYSIGDFLYQIDNIETWCRDRCKDNNFPYNIDLDNRENWNQLWNYLQKPENINLISKFWKDTVGSFAFVHEEIITETTYIQIENNY